MGRGEGYGRFNPLSPDWYKHPGATAYMESGAGAAAQGTYAGALQMPEWAISTGYEDPAEWAKYYGGLEYPGREEAVWRQGQRVVDEQNQAKQDAIKYGQSAYDQYRMDFETASDASIASLQKALVGYRGSTTAGRLGEYSDPNYQAISDQALSGMLMSDEVVNAQRIEAGRGIAKGSANAIGAAVNQAGFRGTEGSGLSTQMQTAARLRQSGEMAGVTSQLKTDQFQHNAEMKYNQQVFNDSVRKWATGVMSDRDKTELMMERDIAAIEGRIPAINPFAAAMMGIMTDRDSLYIDPGMAAMMDDFGTEEWDQALEQYRENALYSDATLESIEDDMEWFKSLTVESLQSEEAMAEFVERTTGLAFFLDIVKGILNIGSVV